MIRQQGFFFLLSLLGKKINGVRHGEERLTDWMMLPLTLYSSVFFCGLKEGNLNFFFFFFAF